MNLWNASNNIIKQTKRFKEVSKHDVIKYEDF